MAKLPERQLTGVGSGLGHGAIRSATLQERKVCARINQRAARAPRQQWSSSPGTR